MNKMRTLIGYEYKKIFMRKSTWIVFAVAIFITLLSCWADTWGMVYVEGEPVYSHYEEMTMDRAYARALAGREVDAELILEMQDAYRHVPDVPLYSATKEYQTYARPYSAIYHLVRSVSKDVENVDGSQYYEMRSTRILEILKEENLSATEVKKHLTRNDKIETPFVFQHMHGYERVTNAIYSLGVTLTFLIAICLAPIFANEYSDRTDQLILTARLGKNKAIHAKLITGISFGILTAILMLLLQCIPILLLHGFDGWNAPIQLMLVSSTNPITILEGILILCGLVMISSILISCLSMFLSARLKSAFHVIVIISFITILSMFLHAPEHNRLLAQMINTLPVNVTSGSSVFSLYFYVVFHQCFTTYEAVPVIYGFISIALVVFGYRSFKNHQIG